MSTISDQIIPVLRKYGVQKAALFGSYARGDHDENSDVDILIQPPKGMGIEFISLKLELEDLVHKKVDLVSYNGINTHLRPYILRNEKPLL